MRWENVAAIDQYNSLLLLAERSGVELFPISSAPNSVKLRLPEHQSTQLQIVQLQLLHVMQVRDRHQSKHFGCQLLHAHDEAGIEMSEPPVPVPTILRLFRRDLLGRLGRFVILLGRHNEAVPYEAAGLLAFLEHLASQTPWEGSKPDALRLPSKHHSLATNVDRCRCIVVRMCRMSNEAATERHLLKCGFGHEAALQLPPSSVEAKGGHEQKLESYINH